MKERFLIREVRENKNSKARYLSVGEMFDKGDMVIVKELKLTKQQTK